jgi:hypothetical protein
LKDRANQALSFLDKYAKGGSHYKVLERLKALRDKRLAHRDIRATMGPPGPDTADDAVEVFYQDMSKLMALLLQLVERISYDPDDTARVFCFHAKFFWASVRGERTEGHPNYRVAPVPPSITV